MTVTPITIDDNFLNDAECSEIKGKVLALRRRWKIVISNKKEQILGCMLPAGMYSKNYDSAGIEDSNAVMMENFSTLYEKVRARLEAYYNIPVAFHKSLQLPGFHAFSNTNPDSTSTYARVNFHKDAFDEINWHMPVGRIESIIVPINLPAAGGSLRYNVHRAYAERFVLKDDDQTFVYKQGTMSMWSGELFHSIGPFTLAPGEYRITLQMHTNITKDKVTVFW